MNWTNDLKFGEVGERVAMISMLESPKTKQLVDVRKDEFFQRMDIDFLQVRNDGKINKVEVKTDRKAHETGNIAFETRSNNNVGRLIRSKADWIYYYIYYSKQVVMVDMDKLRVLILENNFEERKMGDNARGYLLKIDDLIVKGVALRKNVLWEDFG